MQNLGISHLPKRPHEGGVGLKKPRPKGLCMHVQGFGLKADMKDSLASTCFHDSCSQPAHTLGSMEEHT